MPPIVRAGPLRAGRLICRPRSAADACDNGRSRRASRVVCLALSRSSGVLGRQDAGTVWIERKLRAAKDQMNEQGSSIQTTDKLKQAQTSKRSTQ